MKFLSLIFLSLFVLLHSVSLWALTDKELNVRNTNIGTTGNTNSVLEDFISPIQEFFFRAGES